jgi:hypothetical protein
MQTKNKRKTRQLMHLDHNKNSVIAMAPTIILLKNVDIL